MHHVLSSFEMTNKASELVMIHNLMKFFSKNTILKRPTFYKILIKVSGKSQLRVKHGQKFKVSFMPAILN